MKKHFFLILILVFSAFFRFYELGNNPPSLNWDEVSHGYNAYSILKTGRDEWGARFPLIFRAYGDYKLPLYIYLTVPGIAVLGLNAFSIRLISALSGIGLVLVAYLIGEKITSSKKYALLAAFLTAVSPWSLFVSRVALEANLAAFLFSLGVYFSISWIKEPKGNHLTLAMICWGLSLYAYNSARILVPLFLFFFLILIIKKKLLGKESIVPAILFLVFLLPLLPQFFNQSGKARFGLVSLIDQGTVNKIIELRQSSKLPANLSRLLYNRPSFLVFYSLQNYFSNLSPYYLFFRGGSHYQFSLPDHELLYLVTLPFVIAGILKVLKGRAEEKVLLFWFLAAFLPSAITRDAPHALRTILILPAPMLLTALGLEWIDKKITPRSVFKGKLLLVVLVFSVLVSFGEWWKDYWQIYPKTYSWAWQYGYKEAVLFIKENYSRYSRIFFTKKYGEPHEFILSYFPWEPARYQTDPNKVWDYHANWYWLDSFDKFVFFNDWEAGKIKCQNSNCLLLTSSGNYSSGWHKIKTINFLDGQPAFDILENE
ncbi:MAG TPA: glycosyltransferase family 39 protein [Clostridia bacterium]|nr:glycosyltransferase family 39 protein [Clostridia bacterium]